MFSTFRANIYTGECLLWECDIFELLPKPTAIQCFFSNKYDLGVVLLQLKLTFQEWDAFEYQIISII